MERWQQIEFLFQEALERDPAERNAWLREACCGDSGLEREVASRLANHREATDLGPRVAAGAAESSGRPASLKPGQCLGHFRIECFLAAGGMGEVYHATDTRLGRDVAIKVSKADFSERFEREARLIASLNHPNICQLHDVAPNYLVMEFVEGPTLAERIRQGAIAPEESLAIARQISDALEAAHERGIVHRDLKPGNVKIKADGTVKVLDFGLAKLADPPEAGQRTEDSPTVTMDSAATRAGVILGTAAYMPPEQVRGKRVDKRADIWAFGVVLYEMLTGQRLFEGETVSETLIEVATKEPDWARIPAVPGKNLRRLLRRCLEKDPKRRLRDIGDAWVLLEEAGQVSELPDARAHGLRRWAWLGWGLAASLFLIAASLSFIHFREALPPRGELLRFQIPLGDANLSFFARPLLSPNGRMIAYVARDPAGRFVLWVRSLDALEARALAGPENVISTSVVWSPDSRFIGFAAQGKLKKVAISGGAVQTLCDLPGFVAGGTWSGAWSRNGVIVFGAQGHGLMRVSDSGGPTSPVTVLDPSRESSHLAPTFLEDGRHLIYRRNSGSGGGSGLYLGSLDERPDQQSSKLLVAAESNVVYAPSSDPAFGYLLFVRDLRQGSLLAQPFDNRRMELAGEAVPIAEGLTDSLGLFSASENGVLAYRTGNTLQNVELRWFNRAGNNLGTVGDPGGHNTVALSPDGTRAAVSSGSSGAMDIWLHDFSHGTSQRLTFGPTTNLMAAWSPDGGRIAFASNRTGTFDIYQKASSGVGSEDLLLHSSEASFPYDWSPDGRWLLYGSSTRQFDLWLLPLTGDKRKPVPYLANQFHRSQGRFSPDGRYIAYASNESGRNEVYVQPFPEASGGKWLVSKGGGNQPHWRHDGKELFYISTDSKVMAVDVTTTPVFRNGNPKVLFATRISGGAITQNITRYDVTPDGQKFLINTLPAEAAAPASPITVVLNWQMGLKK
jgi:Tol biopolymer transport system component/predicted Ser/Thr protein kinase